MSLLCRWKCPMMFRLPDVNGFFFMNLLMWLCFISVLWSSLTQWIIPKVSRSSENGMLNSVFSPLFVWLPQKNTLVKLMLCWTFQMLKTWRRAHWAEPKPSWGCCNSPGSISIFCDITKGFFWRTPGFSAHFLWSMEKKLCMDLLLFSILDYLCY